MILINIKYYVKPEYQDTFLDEVRWYEEACNAEPGCLFFKFYADPDDKQRYFLVEGYADGADVAHVNTAHFARGCEEMPKYLMEIPDIINVKIPGKVEWDKMAEMTLE